MFLEAETNVMAAGGVARQNSIEVTQVSFLEVRRQRDQLPLQCALLRHS